MNQTKKVHERFAAIKRDFFPHWDRDGKWRLRCEFGRSKSDGKCCVKGHSIRIFKKCDSDELDTLLIHEIAHALHVGHGKKWRERLAKAVIKAERFGRNGLAQLLREEINHYSDDRPDMEPEDHIREWPMELEITWEAVIYLLQEQFDFTKAEAREYKKVYVEARQLHGHSVTNELRGST